MNDSIRPSLKGRWRLTISRLFGQPLELVGQQPDELVRIVTITDEQSPSDEGLELEFLPGVKLKHISGRFSGEMEVQWREPRADGVKPGGAGAIWGLLIPHHNEKEKRVRPLLLLFRHLPDYYTQLLSGIAVEDARGGSETKVLTKFVGTFIDADGERRDFSFERILT